MLKTKKERKKQYFLLLATGLLFTVIIDGFLIRMEYKAYQDKMHLLSVMMSSEDSFQAATELLKGNSKQKGGKGELILQENGYLSGHNIYWKQYRQQMTVTVVISAALYAAYLGAMWLVYHVEKNKRLAVLHELEKVLEEYRNGVYDSVLSGTISGADEKERRIFDTLDSFGGHLDMMSRQIAIEKEEIKSLVTDISHQLKTPVAAIKTCFELLQRDGLAQEERKEFAERCNQQLQGLENLLADLLNISRMETGMIQIKKEDEVVFDTLVEAINRVYLKAEEKEICIEMDAGEKWNSLRVMHDRKWLCEAFINILENAVKYSFPKTNITICMMKRTSFLRIEVQDQGIGIQKREFNDIFKRFYRGRSEYVKHQPGSGIGLYLTREIIIRHGGTITVSSAGPNNRGGSKFVIQLPYKSSNKFMNE